MNEEKEAEYRYFKSVSWDENAMRYRGVTLDGKVLYGRSMAQLKQKALDHEREKNR